MRWFLSTVVGLVAVALMLASGTLAMAHKARTGRWGVPDRHDVRWLAGRVHPVAKPARVVVLSRETLTVQGGTDANFANQTSLLAHGESRTLAGYRGSDRAWNKVVRCVEKSFAAYDVRIAEAVPAADPYVLVHVGGRVAELAAGRRPGTTGLAPYSGEVVPDPIVFVFSADMGERIRETCEVIAHEVGHVYGLDHTLRCGDLMSYLHCGNKRFVDAPARCGESRRRDCGDGSAVQNSHQHLLEVLGERPRRVALR